MVPPEVLLDRWVRTHLQNQRGFSGYRGKLDIERVEPSSLRSLLSLLQETMNEALRLEGVNASGGVEHPPYHFDYLEVGEGISNAHAFQHENFSFVVVILPMVELILHLALRLAISPSVAKLLCFDLGVIGPDAIQGLLSQIQLNFLVAHEYTHHVHRHVTEDQSGVTGVWTELLENDIPGSIDSQAQELDADGYAVYIVLAHLVHGERRNSALADLGRPDLKGTDADELLLTCFFLAVLAFFCQFWCEDIDMGSVDQLRHPPPPVRIKYSIQVAEMWCGQNGSLPQSWFSPERFQTLFRAASEAVGVNARQNWDAQMSYRRSAPGAVYEKKLFEKFEAVRGKRANDEVETERGFLGGTENRWPHSDEMPSSPS